MELTAKAKAKEKAKELVNKLENAKKYSNSTNAMSRELAKQCALIAVDEILTIQSLSNGYAESLKHMSPHNGQRPYWQQVKQEINNL